MFQVSAIWLFTGTVNRMETANLTRSFFLRAGMVTERQEERKHFTSKHQIWVHLCSYRTWANWKASNKMGKTSISKSGKLWQTEWIFYINVNLDFINTSFNSLNLPPFLSNKDMILTYVIGVQKPASGSQSKIVVFHVYPYLSNFPCQQRRTDFAKATRRQMF